MIWTKLKQSGLILLGGAFLALGVVFGTVLLLVGLAVLVVAAVIARFRFGRTPLDVEVTRWRQQSGSRGDLLEGEYTVVRRETRSKQRSRER